MNFPILYAETHYRLKFVSPLYYKKVPEIIADIPIRIIANKTTNLPILLVVKDADRYPIFYKTNKDKYSFW